MARSPRLRSFATIQNWVEDGGEKAQRRIPADYIDWAHSDFSGYIAADELYDGPFCVLSIVDNRTFKRLAYQVLDHAPTRRHVEAFFRRFLTDLGGPGSAVRGSRPTARRCTPGRSPRSSVRYRIRSALPHRCSEVVKAVLSAVARCARSGGRRPHVAARPSRSRRPACRPAQERIEKKVGELFEHRYLFVQRRLSPSERATLLRISRGLPQLRSLRGLMEEVYRLFDRRCRMATALAKLGQLRSRLRRFGRLREVLKKLLAPGLEKALVFLDERLLGTTSNAVERGNRRYRKMQKTVYRVRTQRAIEGRLALDLLREQTCPRPGSDHQDPAQGEGGMMR